jgi:outer membrane receptor protein involved in Fe transport
VVVGTPGGGQRRQQAAFAVTTIDRPVIDQLAPSSTAEVLKLVPGLTVETSGGKNGANIFVRGYPSGGDAEYVTFQSEGVPFFPPATLSFLENSSSIKWMRRCSGSRPCAAAPAPSSPRASRG